MKQTTKDWKTFTALRKAILVNPHDTDILQQIFSIVEINQLYAESAELHNEIVDLVPYSAQAWYNLAFAQRNLNKTDEALFSLEYAVICNPSFEKAYLEYGQLCIANKRYKDFIMLVQPLLTQEHLSSQLLILFSEVFLALDNTSPFAYATLMQLLEHDTNNANIHYLAGRIQLGLGKYKSALKYFKKALEIAPDNAKYHLAIAEHYATGGQNIFALKHLNIANQIAPEMPDTWVALIKHYQLEQKNTKALELLDIAMRYHSDAVFLALRGICLLKLGNREKAFYWLGEAIENNFDDIDLFLTLSPESMYDRYAKLVFGNKF